MLALALGLALLIPGGAEAAVNQAVAGGFAIGPGVSLSVDTSYMDGGTSIGAYTIPFSIAGVSTMPQLIAAAEAAIQAEAVANSYTLTNGIVWPWIQESQVDAKIAAAAPLAKAYSSPTVVLGTAFQPSATRSSDIRASFRIANVLNLTGGAAGDVVMEQADNSGMSTNVVELGRCGNGNTGTLVIGLALNDAIACQISGDVGAGKYVRYRSATTVGTPTYTVLGARQVLQPSN